MSERFFGGSSTEEESWISASDLMTGLMMIFLLITISIIFTLESSEKTSPQQYMVQERRNLDIDRDKLDQERRRLKIMQEQMAQERRSLDIDRDKLDQERSSLGLAQDQLTQKQREFDISQEEMKQMVQERMAQDQKELADDICEDLKEEFSDDGWQKHIQICKSTLTVSFNNPAALFELGKDNLKKEFKSLLSAFFPLYIGVLDKYKEDIKEVRIEGHTDDIGFGSDDELFNYFENMKLSQNRTRSVMKFSLRLPESRLYKDWLIKNMTANGLSSSHPILDATGTIDREKSRRVEFVIRLKPPKSLRELDEIDKNEQRELELANRLKELKRLQ